MIVKIEPQKLFDFKEWMFIWNAMESLSIPNGFIRWANALTISRKACINIQGKALFNFQQQEELCRDVPLLPTSSACNGTPISNDPEQT